MGTRCLTVFKDKQDEEIVVMYRQFDGYYDGHGYELADFLKHKRLCNGLRGDDMNAANGMSCLAAQVVAHFKKKPGGIYLYSAGTRDVWEEYVYIVKEIPGDPEPHISVDGFDGKASDFEEWAEIENCKYESE